MKTIKLANGFKCQIDERILNDMELVDLLAESKEDGTVYSQVVLKIFGKEQRDKLYDSIRKNGIVPLINNDGETYSISDAVADVMAALGPSAKN